MNFSSFSQKWARICIALLPCIIAFSNLRAQLPDGSVAPDWTVTDLNGNEWHLQSLLDEGKTVIIQFSATWCAPCWNYHNTDILSDLYDTFGPNGTDDLMVFFFEGDDTTTDADLHGTGFSTNGDWVTGTTYPIVDNTRDIFDQYAGAYFPTIYTICPDGILVESGPASYLDHLSMAFSDCSNVVTAAAPVITDSSIPVICNEDITLSWEISNFGGGTIESIEGAVTTEDGSVYTYSWSVGIPAGGTDWITIENWSETGQIELQLDVVNGQPYSISNSQHVIQSHEVTTSVLLGITTDNWGEETSWSLFDNSGASVQSIGVNSLGGNTSYTWTLELEPYSCYELLISDVYGDGMYGSQWGATNGSIYLWLIDDETGEPNPIPFFSYTGNYNFTNLSIGLHSALVVLGGCTDSNACNFEPTAAIDNGTCVFPGCTDDTAENYEPNAGCDDGSCIYFEPTCEFLGNEHWSEYEVGTTDFSGELLLGAWGSVSNVLNVPTSISDNSNTLNLDSIVVTSIAGLPNGIGLDLATNSFTSPSQTCLQFEGLPLEAGDFEVTLTIECYSTFFGAPILIETIESMSILSVLNSDTTIVGCTYSLANNFNPIATLDDGSCQWLGCTDSSASNFNPWATNDDGSCILGFCSSDSNGDGIVNTSDLLALLGEFGLQCE